MRAKYDDVVKTCLLYTSGYVPPRYTYVDLGWGQKYTIPAYKHYTVDGVDHIQDDSNRYLVYGINQDLSLIHI